MNTQTLDFNKPADRPKGPNPKTTAVFCGLMAFLIFCVSTFLIVDGVRATEPDSWARYTRIAQGVTFLLSSLILFAVGGLFPRFKKGALYFGIAVFTINSVLMSISMISNGKTASKIAAQSAGVIATLEANNNAARTQIELVQSNAKKLSTSRFDWNQAQASKDLKGVDKAGEELKKDSEKLIEARTKGAAVATPLTDVIGETGLYIVSGVLAVAMEALSGYFMLVMGELLREASGAITAETHMIEMMHKIYGGITTGQHPAPQQAAAAADRTALTAPAVPGQISFAIRTAPAPQNAAPASPTAQDKPVATATAVTKPDTAAPSSVVMPSFWQKLVAFGATGAGAGAGAAEPPVPASTPAATPPSISAPGRLQAVPKLTNTVNTTAPDAVQSTAAADKTAPAQVQSTVIADATAPDAVQSQKQSTAPAQVQSAPATETSRASTEVPGTAPATAQTVQRKAKQKRVPAPQELPAGDTLSEQAKVKWVYEKVRDAVRAEEIKPSTRGLRAVIGCSDPEAGSHLARMAADGTIIFNTEKKQGWKLAPGQSTKQEVKVA